MTKFFERIITDYVPSQPGRAILLNGVSSSGKSSLAAVLKEALPAPYLHISLDALALTLPQRVLADDDLFVPEIPKIVYAFHRMLPVLLAAGNNVIIDHVFQESAWRDDCLVMLEGYNVVRVGLHAPREVLREREAARGDRVIGLVDFQFDRVHEGVTYDVEIDTSTTSTMDAARMIVEKL